MSNFIMSKWVFSVSMLKSQKIVKDLRKQQGFLKKKILHDKNTSFRLRSMNNKKVPSFMASNLAWRCLFFTEISRRHKKFHFRNRITVISCLRRFKGNGFQSLISVISKSFLVVFRSEPSKFQVLTLPLSLNVIECKQLFSELKQWWPGLWTALKPHSFTVFGL